MPSPKELPPSQDPGETPSESNGFIEDNLSHETEQKQPLDDAKLAAQGIATAAKRISRLGRRGKESTEREQKTMVSGAPESPFIIPVLSRKERRQREQDILAYRHQKDYGSLEQKEGTVSGTQRKWLVRKARLGVLTGKLTPAEARSETIRIQAMPLDYGESGRKSFGKNYEPKQKRTGFSPAEQEVLQEIDRLRAEGMPVDKIKRQLNKQYHPDAPGGGDYDKAATANYRLRQLANAGEEESEFSKPVIDLGRTELGYLKSVVDQAIAEEITTAETVHDRKLNREEFLEISSRTPREVVRQYLGDEVDEEDVDNVVELLSRVRTPRQQPRQTGRQAVGAAGKRRSTPETTGAIDVDSLSEDEKKHLLTIDRQVKSAINARKASWGTLTPTQEREKNKEVRNEIYRRYFPELDDNLAIRILETIKALKDLEKQPEDSDS